MHFVINFCFNFVLQVKCLIAQLIQSINLIYLSKFSDCSPLYLALSLKNFVAHNHLQLCIKFFDFHLKIIRCRHPRNLIKIY